MEFKVLKHKTLEDTFGVFRPSDNTEIWQSSTPQLLGVTATMEYFKNANKGTIAERQLDDYELKTYLLTEKK